MSMAVSIKDLSSHLTYSDSRNRLISHSSCAPRTDNKLSVSPV